jgi:RecB family endonuclease NucS
MPKTLAANDLHRERLEASIEAKLATYPYLIAEGLPHPKRQVWITHKDRVDLFFECESGILIAEIKAKPCRVGCVRQLVRYLQILSGRHPDVRGILIGPRLSEAAIEVLASCPFNIRFLQLDVDVPSSIVVCREGRHAFAARLSSCPQCGCREVVS